MSILALESPTFQPAMRVVTAVTQANPASVTTSFDHDYADGIIVRIYVPSTFGMTQLNHMTGTITVTGSDTFTIDVDTTNFDAFAVPSSNKQYAQVVAIGEINSSIANAERNVL